MQAGVVSFCCFLVLVISACGQGWKGSLGWYWLRPNTRETGKHLSWWGKDPHCGGQLSHQEGGLLTHLHIKIPEI